MIVTLQYFQGHQHNSAEHILIEHMLAIAKHVPLPNLLINQNYYSIGSTSI